MIKILKCVCLVLMMLYTILTFPFITKRFVSQEYLLMWRCMYIVMSIAMGRVTGQAMYLIIKDNQC